jgi:hypothetical protein
MAGATHPLEITAAKAKWPLCWSLRERRTGVAGTGESAYRSTDARGAGPRVRPSGVLIHWLAPLKRKSLRSSVSTSTLSDTQVVRKVCRRCAICDFLNNAR